MQIKIDYNNSILSVSNSILKYFNGTSLYKTLPELDAILKRNYKNIVLMIIDCMGTSIINNNLPEYSFLHQHILKNISSVFPPTTAAATTAFHSGLPPVYSGWIGWMCYFRQYNKIIELFKNTEFYSGKPIIDSVANEYIKYETIYSQIINANNELEYYKIFPPFDSDGVQCFKEMCERIVQVTKQNSSRKIISAYWNEPDHFIHQYGTKNQKIKDILEDIEQNIINMNEKIEDTLVIISADHGAVDVDEIYLNSYPDICETFIRPPALEARFVTFFIKSDKCGVFENLFYKYFSDDFILFTKEEFLSSGILGPGKIHESVPSMIGDFVAIGFKNRSLRYSTGEKVFPSLKADHAGYTQDEMTVPLIVLEAK